MQNCLHPDVWTTIQQNLTKETHVFKDLVHLEEDSFENFIENAFQIRYSLIMNRYKFFTYVHKGNQTFTNYFAKLRKLAAAAQLEYLNRNDYLIFRVITDINDPDSLDKLLSIPQADFNIKEIHQVTVACEAAKNYTDLSTKSKTLSLKVSNKKPHQASSKLLTGINAKLNALRQQGKYIRCGRKAHPSGDLFPKQNTTCHNCGVKGHIFPVFTISQLVTNSKPEKNHANQTNTSNYTFADSTFQGPRPTHS